MTRALAVKILRMMSEARISGSGRHGSASASAHRCLAPLLLSEWPAATGRNAVYGRIDAFATPWAACGAIGVAVAIVHCLVAGYAPAALLAVRSRDRASKVWALRHPLS